MLQINHLTVSHTRDLRVIINDLSFALNKGDKAVIIGEEGNGKSTLLKWIYDPELTADYTECTGERILGGERCAYLPQEMPAAYADTAVYDYFSECEDFWSLKPSELAETARTLGLPADVFFSEQKMGTLSGGEKVKLQMARLLMGSPTVLLLDEPSNDLDIETLEWLEGLINSWPNIVLFISHDETLIENTANVVIHLEQLRRKMLARHTVARMPYTRYVTERLDAFEKQEQIARGEMREKRIKEEKFQRIQQSVEQAQSNISRQDPHGGRLLKKKMHQVKALEHRMERESENMTELPEYEDAINIRFDDDASGMPGGKTVLELNIPELYAPDGSRVLAHNIGLIIKGPERICLIGKNGAGKTTLLRAIYHMLLERTDIKCTLMPQNYADSLDLSMTAVDFLDVSGEKDERTRIRTILGSLKYTADEMDHPMSALSGGQRAKVLLLRLILSGANVLLLDEPTRNFSPLSGPVIRAMLRSFPGAIISISHDRKYINEVSTKILELKADGLHEIRAAAQ